MTIGVLAPYRRRNVGRKLLEWMLANVQEGKGELGDITEVGMASSRTQASPRV